RVVAWTVDLAVQHADRSTNELQQHRGARQRGLRGRVRAAALLRDPIRRRALPRHDRRARAAVAPLQGCHGVEGLQRLKDVSAMTAPDTRHPTPRVKVFRWRAVGPLLVFFVIGGVLWWLFADTIARRTSEKVGTQLLGAKVEIQRLHLD